MLFCDCAFEAFCDQDRQTFFFDFPPIAYFVFRKATHNLGTSAADIQFASAAGGWGFGGGAFDYQRISKNQKFFIFHLYIISDHQRTYITGLRLPFGLSKNRAPTNSCGSFVAFALDLDEIK